MFTQTITRAMNSNSITPDGIAQLIALVNVMKSEQRITFIESALQLARATQDQRSAHAGHTGSLIPVHTL